MLAVLVGGDGGVTGAGQSIELVAEPARRADQEPASVAGVTGLPVPQLMPAQHRHCGPGRDHRRVRGPVGAPTPGRQSGPVVRQASVPVAVPAQPPARGALHRRTRRPAPPALPRLQQGTGDGPVHEPSRPLFRYRLHAARSGASRWSCPARGSDTTPSAVRARPPRSRRPSWPCWAWTLARCRPSPPSTLRRCPAPENTRAVAGPGYLAEYTSWPNRGSPVCAAKPRCGNLKASSMLASSE